MVPGRGGPSAEAEEGRGSALVADSKAILGAVSWEKSRRDTGILEYDL